MDVYVIRHADAGKRMSNGRADIERTLSVSGKRDVETLRKMLRILEVEADYIISSGLKRALETADALMDGGPTKAQRLVWKELNPESSHESFLERISTLPRDATVFAVGHNPFLQSMISSLISSDGAETAIALKKCGIAKIEVNSFAPTPTGELKWLLTPKLERRASNGRK